MLEAIKIYGGDTFVAQTKDNVNQSASVFREGMEIIKHLFVHYDLTSLLDLHRDPAKRYVFLEKPLNIYLLSQRRDVWKQKTYSRKVHF